MLLENSTKKVILEQNPTTSRKKEVEILKAEVCTILHIFQENWEMSALCDKTAIDLRHRGRQSHDLQGVSETERGLTDV